MQYVGFARNGTASYNKEMKKPPKPYQIAGRPGLWAAKGVDPTTQARKNYYGNSAEEALTKALRSLQLGDDYSLFHYYASSYIPSVKHLSKNWLNQIAWAMDKHVMPELGSADIRDIKRADLQRFVNSISTKMSASSVSKVRKVLSGVIRLAQADEIIANNPLTFVRMPKIEPPRKTALTLYQLKCLVEASGPLVKPFVIFAGCAGLRLGEALGVTRAAIDRSGVVKVYQQVQQFKGECIVSSKLKTDHSYRDLPFPADMLEALLNCGQVSDIWVCSDSKGGYVRPKNITRELRIACKLAKVPVVSPHELRHTFISLMDNEIEAPRTVVMALAGHSPQTTTDGYSHTKIEQKKRWLEKLWEQMSTACDPEDWATKQNSQVQLNLAK